MQNYTALIKTGVPINLAFQKALQGTSVSFQKQVLSCWNNTNALDQLIAKQKQAALSANLSQIAMQGLYAAGGLFASWAIGEGLQLAITALNNYIHRVDIAKEKIQEISSSIDDFNQSFQSHANLVEEAKESYSRLASGVDLTDNTNLSLSNEDYETFLALNNELVEAFPQLLAGLDEQDNAILRLGTNAKSSADALQMLIDQEKEMNNFQIAQEVPELFSNVKTVLADSVQKTKQLDEQFSASQNSFATLNNFASGNFATSEENPFQLEFEYPTSDEIGMELSNIVSKAVQAFLNNPELSNKDILSTTLFSTDIDYSDGENLLFRSLLDVSTLTEDQRSELFSLIEKEAKAVEGKATDILGDMETQLNLTRSQTDNMWADFTPNLLYLTRSKQTYQNLDEDLQKIAEQMIVSLDYSNVLADMDEKEPYAYILEHIITPLQNLSEDDKVKLSNLISEDSSPQDIEKLVNTITRSFSIVKLEDPMDILHDSLDSESIDKQDLIIPENLARAQERVLSSLGVSFKEYDAIKEESAASGTDLFQALDNEISLLAAEGLISQEAATALFYYQLQKALANENGLSMERKKFSCSLDANFISAIFFSFFKRKKGI